MLGKLMKYELKNIFKFLTIFYVLAVVFAILTRVLFMISDSLFWNIVAQVMSGATIAMIINIVINNLMRLWVRFRVSLYGDESYLTHTLPVRRSELYLSKFLVGLATTICSVLVIFCVVAIAYLTPENFEALKGALSFLGFLVGATDMAVVKFVLVVAVVLWLEIFSALVVGHLGIILGHKKLTNRMAWSVGFGLLIYVATQVVVMLGIMALSLVDAGVHDLMFGGGGLGFDSSGVAESGGASAVGSGGSSVLGAFKAVTVSATVLYAVLVGVNYVVSQRVFRKVDVE